MKIKLIHFFQAIAIVLLVTGCVTPMIPKTVMSGVSQPPVEFKEVAKNTDNYIGRTVLWGGEIIKLTNDKEMTTVEVLQAPTDSDGQPTSMENSQGRFLAVIKEYMDTEVYKKGRQITVVGKVQGKREQTLEPSKTSFTYPVVEVDHFYLWPKQDRYYYAPAYYYGPPYWDGYWSWGSYWGPRWGWGFGFNYYNGFDWDDPY